ncbi:MAG: hypothetical protein HY378_01560 [Candidatus Brennerbacteria bacterium]|nr:hypothetical protein [Candidatus Brennerbacteria bacterium]
MDFGKNKTLITVVVLFVVLGLVLAYVPLLFAPSPNSYPAEEQAAQLKPPVAEPESPTAPAPTSTEVEEEAPLPESFSGLEEESESLDGILEGY